MVISLEDVKLYLRVTGDEENMLITSFINTAEEMCEGILRFPLSTFTQVPETVKQAIFYAVGNMYEEREKANMKDVLEIMKNTLFAYRSESW